MSEKSYERIRQMFLAHPLWYEILKFLYHVLPYVVSLIYCKMLACLFWHHDQRIVQILFVPALIFVIGTGLRAKINAKRPYEKKITPLISKETKGNSFPSRHLLSAGVILSCAIYLDQDVILLLILCILIGICRVLAGVHSCLDVLCGFLFGLLLGLVLLFL